VPRIGPFSRKEKGTCRAIPKPADITEAVCDNERLGPDEWIATSAPECHDQDPESLGLPRGAGADEVYRVASKVCHKYGSRSPIDDGVYCPVWPHWQNLFPAERPHSGHLLASAAERRRSPDQTRMRFDQCATPCSALSLLLPQHQVYNPAAADMRAIDRQCIRMVSCSHPALRASARTGMGRSRESRTCSGGWRPPCRVPTKVQREHAGRIAADVPQKHRLGGEVRQRPAFAGSGQCALCIWRGRSLSLIPRRGAHSLAATSAHTARSSPPAKAASGRGERPPARRAAIPGAAENAARSSESPAKPVRGGFRQEHGCLGHPLGMSDQMR